MRSFGNLDMMGDAGFEAPGAEGAADIYIVSGSNVKQTEFSSFNPPFGRRFKDQCIGTGS